MSYGFMVWAVDLDNVKEACGSRDERWSAGIDHPHIADVINGGPYEGASGSDYHYAFKALVDQLGMFLDNSAVYPIGASLEKSVDEALKGMGVTAISLGKLSSGDLPVELPRAEDFPGSGHLTRDQVKEAKAQLDAATYSGGDPDVEAALGNIRGWVERASSFHMGLIGFYH